MTEITIISNKPSKTQKIKELIRYKQVILFLSWKDIIVRYKQTILGVLWGIIQPIFSMIIMTFIFGKVANLSSDGVPYSVMVFTALIPWNFFSSGMNSVANSLVGNSNLITKIYFPRLALPISSLITACIDSLISFGVLAIMMILFRYTPPLRILFLPIFYVLAFMITLGIGMFFATLNVRYRDIKYLVPFILQFGLYVSPVGYSSSVVPAQYRIFYSLNPMVGVIEGFRWCVTKSTEIYMPSIIISIISAILLLCVGIIFFNKFENSFADFI